MHPLVGAGLTWSHVTMTGRPRPIQGRKGGRGGGDGVCVCVCVRARATVFEVLVCSMVLPV